MNQTERYKAAAEAIRRGDDLRQDNLDDIQYKRHLPENLAGTYGAAIELLIEVAAQQVPPSVTRERVRAFFLDLERDGRRRLEARQAAIDDVVRMKHDAEHEVEVAKRNYEASPGAQTAQDLTEARMYLERARVELVYQNGCLARLKRSMEGK